MPRAFLNWVWLLALVSAAVASAPALAAVDLTEWKDVAAVTGSGTPASAEQIKRAFMASGAQRGWVFTDNGAGKMTGKLVLRTHTLMMELSYEAGRYSLRYLDSVNLDYKDDRQEDDPSRLYQLEHQPDERRACGADADVTASEWTRPASQTEAGAEISSPRAPKLSA